MDLERYNMEIIKIISKVKEFILKMIILKRGERIIMIYEIDSYCKRLCSERKKMATAVATKEIIQIKSTMVITKYQ
jgi:hypothetical protein